MIVYKTEHPDYGWMVHENMEALLDAVKAEVEANELPPTSITIEIKIEEMTQEEIDALPLIDL